MDAWAEVRHDLDYKHILGHPGEDELRVLDAIKGKIASCEIMQDHLLRLRDERIQVDSVPFSTDLEQFSRAVIASLRPRHRILVQKFTNERPVEYKYLMRLVVHCNIRTPAEFKKSLVELDDAKVLKRKISLSQEALALARSLYREGECFQMLEEGKEPVEMTRFEWSLWSFLSVYLLSRLSSNQIDLIIHSDMRFAPVCNLSDWKKAVSPLGGVQKNDERWLRISCRIQEALFKYCKDVQEDGTHRSHRVVAFITAWHVHEWASAVAGTYSTFSEGWKHRNLEVPTIVSRLLNHFQLYQGLGADGLIPWICVVTVHAELAVHLDNVSAIALRSALFIGRYGHNHAAVDLQYLGTEYFTRDTWTEGRRIAAGIMGVEVSYLKAATLFRAVYEKSCNIHYVRHCIQDEEVDINWQGDHGCTILAAAITCGTSEISDMILSHPKVNVNLSLSDGLSPLHLAILCKKTELLKQLITFPTLDFEAVWETQPAPYHHLYFQWLGLDHIQNRDIWTWNRWTALKLAEILDLKQYVEILREGIPATSNSHIPQQ